MGFCPRVFRVSFSCFRGFSLVSDPRGRLGGKVGSACEEFVDQMLYIGLTFLRVWVPAHPGGCCCELSEWSILCSN